MDRCPNCGSAVRLGAKFCTSCGFRLPEPTPEPIAPTPPRSPFATTSSVAASWWPTVAGGPTADSPTPPPTIGTPPHAEEPTAAEPAPAAVADEPVAFESWRAAAGAYAPAPAAQDSGLAGGTLAAETASASVGTAQEPSSGGPPPAVEIAPFPAERAAGDAAWEPRIVAHDRSDTADKDEPPMQTAGSAAVADTGAPAIGASESPAGSAASLGAVAADERPIAPPSPVPVAAEETGRHGSESLVRALNLLDELQAILPTLAVPEAVGPAVDPEAVASALAAARQQAPDEAGTFDGLRDAIATARERRRDIDVMLGLINQIDAVAALQEAHDRYVTAIDQAIATLRSE